MSNILLQAEGVCKSYQRGEQRIEVLTQVELQVAAQEMIAIIGASGSGKTTLLQILGTLDSAESGSIHFEGQDLAVLSDNELAAHRNTNIGFIFQFHHLLPEFTAVENIMMPGLIRGHNKVELKNKAIELLQRVHLDHRASHRSGELSGGEQQRVALARALILSPKLLLADEPTGNLDSRSGNLVFSLLQELTQSLGLSVVMVTHNMELASQLDSSLTLVDGSLH